MKSKIRRIFYLLLGTCLLTSLSFSGGFLIYEHGAAAMAQGGAFVARAYDPSALFHNPAGIAWLSGTQISLGTTLITSKSSVELPKYSLIDPTWTGSANQKSQIFYPSTFYLTHSLNEKITLGLGFFSPYGLGTEWENPKTFPLRYIAYKTDMKTFFINPTVAYRINENFSIAFGVSYIYANIKYKRYDILEPPMVPMPMDIEVILEGKDSFAFGFNAGLLYKKDNFSFGLSYRSRSTLNFEGDLSMGTLMKMSGKADIKLPDVFMFGIAYKISDRFEVEGDVQYTLWSVYDELVLKVEGLEDQKIEQNWENVFIFRIGGQYQLNESFALRAGFLYDFTPQPVEFMDSSLPDADRWAVTAGFGYKVNNFAIDFAFQYEPFQDRTSPNREIYDIPFLGNLGEGTYSTTAYLFGISFTYQF